VTDDYGTIGGGGNNQAGNNAGSTSDATYATVCGGVDNDATGSGATVGGGGENIASGGNSTVGGGRENIAGGLDATVGGGGGNSANGNFSTVAGGSLNLAQGNYSFAAGRRAKADGEGSFVWGDSNDLEIHAWGANEFVARATGGFWLITSIDPTTGVPLSGCFIAAGSSDCAGPSDRNIKENFAHIDSNQILKTLSALPIQTWNYKSQSPAIRHIGPVAQDFNNMFAYLFNEAESPVHINKMDEIGISLAAIQGVYHLVKEKDARIETLEAQVATLEQRLSTIEALITEGIR